LDRGRERVEWRESRRDTFTAEDVDRFRRDLLASHLSPRTVQKILVLLHGVFKLAKRRKLITTNPSEDAERVTIRRRSTSWNRSSSRRCTGPRSGMAAGGRT
jgi:hypothetical protein